MKLKINKVTLKAFALVLCYVSTIVATMAESTITKYGMYAFIIATAVIASFFERNNAKIYKNLPYLSVYVCLIIGITFIKQVFSVSINPGTLIQPFFLLAAFKLGYSIAICDGEDGCYHVLIQFSHIIALAAVVSVLEYILKISIFYPNYGHVWETFRVPSIYGHPIRLGTSLTIGLAIYGYLYSKSCYRYILIILSVFGIYVCQSRSSWLACAGTVALIVFAVYRKKLTKKKLLYGMSILIFLCSFYFCSNVGQDIIQSIYQRFSEVAGDSVSKVQRLGTISYVWNDIITNFNPFTFLFGHGEDAAKNLMLQTRIVLERFSTTDNQYVLIAYNYGFVFLVTILTGIFKCIKQFVIKYDKSTNVMKCLYFICVSQAICSFFYELTENKSCAFIVMCSIGMLMGRKHMIKIPSLVVGDHDKV